jgi:predicted transcriptional regulator
MIENVAEIVAAFVKRNQVPTTELLPALIASVSQSLASLGQAPAAASAPITPAVSIRRSVGADALTCLDCGFKSKMIKRHLSTRHAMTPDEYRAKWGLPKDYPMTAPNYTAHRSELAKALGLGRWGGSRRKRP